jgi:hypothetical protein
MGRCVAIELVRYKESFDVKEDGDWEHVEICMAEKVRIPPHMTGKVAMGQRVFVEPGPYGNSRVRS